MAAEVVAMAVVVTVVEGKAALSSGNYPMISAYSCGIGGMGNCANSQ